MIVLLVGVHWELLVEEIIYFHLCMHCVLVWRLNQINYHYYFSISRSQVLFGWQSHLWASTCVDWESKREKWSQIGPKLNSVNNKSCIGLERESENCQMSAGRVRVSSLFACTEMRNAFRLSGWFVGSLACVGCGAWCLPQTQPPTKKSKSVRGREQTRDGWTSTTNTTKQTRSSLNGQKSFQTVQMWCSRRPQRYQPHMQERTQKVQKHATVLSELIGRTHYRDYVN